MPNDFTTGLVNSGTLTGGLRPYYDQLLLETLRNNAVFWPYVQMKYDMQAKATGQMIFTEVYDTEPNWNPRSESDYFLSGAQVGSRSVTLQMAIYGEVMKFTDYSEIVNFFNNGNFRGLINGKLGINLTETLDILAMNAMMDSPFVTYAGGKTRFTMTAADVYDPDLGELAYIHLQERLIPGLINPNGGEPTVVGITSPRVIHDIRTGTSSQTKWIDTVKYALPNMKLLSHEMGQWGGVRYVKSTRLRRYNYGAVTNQSTLTAPTVAQQGGAASVFGVYTTAADATAARYVTVTSGSGFAIGQRVTIHSGTVYDSDGAGGKAPSKTDGTQEHRLIVDIQTNNIFFDKPLLKPHAAGDYVTKGVDLNFSIILGGQSIAAGVGEMPTLVVPPKTDDLQMVNRLGWRSFMKVQMFRPEWTEMIVTGGSVT